MLTLNGSLANDQPKTNHKIQCFLLNEEGAIKNVQIPFHLILSDKSNQRVRDTILLKKLKSFLRSENKETSKTGHLIVYEAILLNFCLLFLRSAVAQYSCNVERV